MSRIISLTITTFIISAIAATPALAVPPDTNATLSTPGAAKTLTLPPQSGNSPVISLGTVTDPVSGKKVEGFAIIHDKQEFARPSGKGKPPKDNTGSSCYSLMANGAKWKTTEAWKFNTTATAGVSETYAFNSLTDSITSWEDAADSNPGDGVIIDILGSGTQTTDLLLADTASPDGENEVYYADVDSPGAIAVTIVWGIFSGKPAAREIRPVLK